MAKYSEQDRVGNVFSDSEYGSIYAYMKRAISDRYLTDTFHGITLLYFVQKNNFFLNTQACVTQSCVLNENIENKDDIPMFSGHHIAI